MLDNVFKQIDEMEEEFITFIKDVCELESQTIDKEGVDSVGRYFIERANEVGFKVEVYPQDKSGDVVVITMNEGVNAPLVALSGHIDTVHPKGLFGYPAVKDNGEEIVAPGITDCKGGIVGAFMAMKALKNLGYKDRPIMLLLQSDEETGSSTSGKKTINYICERAKNALAFLNLEPYSPNQMCLERKGILRFEFTVTGIAWHSSTCYKGANAVTEACHKIIELEKLKSPEGLTCNCGVIKGGTVANSVAEKCVFTADVRFSTQEEMDLARNIMKQVNDKITVKGCSSVVKEISSRPAMEKSQKNYELADKLNQIFVKAGLPYLQTAKCMGGSDTAYTTCAGIPSIDCLGVEGGKIHSEREFMKKSSLKECAKRLASAILYL